MFTGLQNRKQNAKGWNSANVGLVTLIFLLRTRETVAPATLAASKH